MGMEELLRFLDIVVLVKSVSPGLAGRCYVATWGDITVVLVISAYSSGPCIALQLYCIESCSCVWRVDFNCDSGALVDVRAYL